MKKVLNKVVEKEVVEQKVAVQAEEGTQSGQTEPPEERVEIPLSEVNSFMSIIDAVLIEDVRAEVIIKHFTKMLIKSNPHLNRTQS